MEDPGARTDTLLRRYVREAATATSWESGHQIEIQLGHFCNNRCVFCVSGQLTQDKLARPIGEAPVLEALEGAAAKGITRVTFLGGEPTIQKSFEPALQRALDLGFTDIVIFTNGAQGRNPRFMERVMAMGEFTWRFSIQGGTEEAHDRVTGRKGSFRRLATAMERLAAAGQDITANMCVNTLSYESLPAYPELVAKHNIRQLHLDMVRPENTGRRTEQELRDMVPRHTDMAPYIRQMLERFEETDPDFDVNIGNLPYCVLPEWADRIHHGGEPTLTLTTGHRGELDTILRKYTFQAIDAVYGPDCEQCVFFNQCRGVPEKYAEFYGTGELVPVSREALRTLDPRQRAFVHEAEAWVELLLAADCPAGWRLETLRRDGRERQIHLSFRHDDSGVIALKLSPAIEPPKGTLAARFASPRARLSAGRHGPAATSLLEWAAQALRAGGEPMEPVAAPPTRSELQSLLLAVRRLKARKEFGDWQLRGVRSAPDRRSVRLTLVDVDGPRILVRLLAGPPCRVEADSADGEVTALLARLTATANGSH
ncbi:MAG: MoaA/NifB/PqqE/SkfB family radical SAM enzyme [Myxococcota bacterium]|jgi:MoaA/NifB/PqqE/SkfB family radical SAM enzyme